MMTGNKFNHNSQTFLSILLILQNNIIQAYNVLHPNFNISKYKNKLEN